MSRILEDNSTESWTYTYDANGMRLSRSSGTDADDVTYTYVYTDGLLSRMTKGDIMLYFTYDAVGMPLTVSIHTGTNCKVKKGEACGTDCKTYYYVTNLQGDVIAILDDSGTAITLYQYDAWGYPTLTLDVSDDDIGTINPLRYRGYVYDNETGFYYLQSRYYNPEISRFISADSYMSTGDGILGNNMFAYCHNNPIVFVDPTGEDITLGAFLAGVAITALIGGAIATGVTVIKDYSDDGEIFNGSVKAREYFGNVVEGLIAGAGIGACITLGAGLGAAMIANKALVVGGVTLSGLGAFGLGASIAFSTGAIGYTVNTAINTDLNFEWSDMFIAAGSNMASGMLSFVGGMAGGITGVKVPETKVGFKTMVQNAVKYHFGLLWFGVYPSKFLLSRLEVALKEAY
ncbi:MAG: RHS repeat-associated core domain-containing protein [Ruminococcaceae bacterium]|nr:RHS repeat-associated core domain-containing protein [Oscillospiraceae bacterium]